MNAFNPLFETITNEDPGWIVDVFPITVFVVSVEGELGGNPNPVFRAVYDPEESIYAEYVSSPPEARVNCNEILLLLIRLIFATEYPVVLVVNDGPDAGEGAGVGAGVGAT
jgi:hypothetical protein